MSPILRRTALAATLALTAPALLAAGPPTHAPAFDEVGIDASEWAENAAGGDGQLNGEFVIAERGHVQIGLRITDRTDGLLDAEGKHGVGRYTASSGFDTGTTDRAEWNYDIHVDLRGSGTTLADYDLTFDTNIADALFGLDLPANFAALGDPSTQLLQISWNPLFGNDTFDPAAEGKYDFRLTLKPKDGGPSLSVKAIVTVTD